MPRLDRMLVLAVLAVATASALGCRSCCTPSDYCGPVETGCGNDCCFLARKGSILGYGGPAGYGDGYEEGYSEDGDVIYDDQNAPQSMEPTPAEGGEELPVPEATSEWHSGGKFRFRPPSEYDEPTLAKREPTSRQVVIER